jgi:hypothetical protein
MAAQPRILIVQEGGGADRDVAEVGLALAAADGSVAVLLAFVPTRDPRTPKRVGPLAHALAQEVEPDPNEAQLAWAVARARERGVPYETRVIATNSRRLAMRTAAERFHASTVVVGAHRGAVRQSRSLAHEVLTHGHGATVLVASGSRASIEGRLRRRRRSLRAH